MDRDLHEFAEQLVSHQRDFELIDEVTLCEQDPAEFSKLRPYFIVAHATRIERSAAQWLERYAAAGGHLFVVGVTPEILPEPDAAKTEKWTFADTHRDQDFIAKIPAPELKGEQAENILIRRIRKNGMVRTFLFNRGHAVFRGTLDGETLEIAPGEAGFADELCIREKVLPLTVPAWKLTFGPNSVPLHYWESSAQNAYDLLAKQNTGLTPVPEEGRFFAVFTLETPLKKVLFTTEEETLSRGSFELNGTRLTDYRKADFRDCRELECDVSSILKSGRNVLTFQGRLIENAPYLRGQFRVAFPLGNCGYPVLSVAPGSFELTQPQDYRTLGYGTFSGTALYEGLAEVAEAGRYMLDLKLVKDSVRIRIDGAEHGVLIAPPYRMEIELAAGKHTVSLEVCNAPGNRDVLAGVPAGLQS